MEEDKVIVKKLSVAETEDGKVIVKKPSVTETEDGKVIVKRSPVTETEDGKVIAKELQTQQQEAYNESIQETEMRMIVSAMLRKDGKSFARVSFFRGKDWAEGLVPDGVVEQSEGFTEEEIRGLEDYLVREKDMLVGQAKGVNPLRNMLGM